MRLLGELFMLSDYAGINGSKRCLVRCLADDKSLEGALQDIINHKVAGGYEGNKPGQEDEEEE